LIRVYSCVDPARCLDALDCDAPGPCTAGLVDQLEVAIDDGEIELDEITVHLRRGQPIAFRRDGMRLQVDADHASSAAVPLTIDALGGQPVAGSRLHVALTSEAADFATVELLVRPAP
jgi:hypothetical protein